jgi:hypothetical protein
LEKEFQSNGWELRLSKCEQKRVDPDFEFAAGSRSYHRQVLTKFYENDLLVAFIVDYTLHDGRQIRHPKMLLVDGVRHIVPWRDKVDR